MRIFKLIYVFYKINLLSPIHIIRFLKAINKSGINLMTLLNFAGKTHGNSIAIVDDIGELNYQQLLSQSEKLSFALVEQFNLKSGQKVGFLCKNHVSLVKAIFAVSGIGADIYLLNTEMSKSQFNQLVLQHNFDLLIYDPELGSLIAESNYKKEKILSDHLGAINNLRNEGSTLKRTSMSKIMLLTGGTTGKAKEVAHKPSIFNYLNPFLALLTRLKLINYETVYIATPIYHGYGVALLILFIALGKKVVISSRFDAQRACKIIREHNVQVVSVVPLMIHKMLKTNPADLKSIACIASGGAPLNPKLVGEVFSKLGDVLYNLYGTSEAGLNIVATPQDLKYSPDMLGKKISGVRLKVLDKNKENLKPGIIGQFCIKNNWSMKNAKSSWIETGDLGYRDQNGYYFLCGRTDDMVVSAGENVYPIELERVLITHPQIEEVAVIGISDEIFGQRLKAFIVADLTEVEIYNWLKPRVARFQMPKEIEIIEKMPYTSVGKLDKKQLR